MLIYLLTDNGLVFNTYRVSAADNVLEMTYCHLNQHQNVHGVRLNCSHTLTIINWNVLVHLIFK